jgi:hypothetical protein
VALDLVGDFFERRIKNWRKLKLQLKLEQPVPEKSN